MRGATADRTGIGLYGAEIQPHAAEDLSLIHIFLWKSADKAPLAAEAMGIIAPRLKELKLIDSIIPEPLGGRCV